VEEEEEEEDVEPEVEPDVELALPLTLRRKLGIIEEPKLRSATGVAATGVEEPLEPLDALWGRARPLPPRDEEETIEEERVRIAVGEVLLELVGVFRLELL